MQQQKTDKKIQKLQQEIDNFQRQLTLQKKQKDVIKNYKMVEGDYQILISIHQANDLMPRGTNFFIFKTQKTVCDAFVEVQIEGHVQRTQVRQNTNNPIFDEKFQFKFDNMTLEQIDRATINFKIYDRKLLMFPNSLIGSFQLDWTNVYFKRNHQIYHGWLTLMDPNDQQEGITGYLLVSIAVLGKQDKVTIHDSAFIKDPLTTIQDTITMPKLKLIDYGINIQIYRAENLLPLDEFAENVDAYVIAKFSGNKIQTSVKTSCNPHWDQLLRIGTGVPTKSKYITLQVRNRNYVTTDDILGIIKIPFVDLQQQSTPRWGHLYGPPVTGKDIEPFNYATKMQVYGQQMGSHYRGRILYKITGHKDIINQNSRTKLNFKFPFKPTPVVALKSYTLRLQILDGFSLPQLGDRKQCFIHCCIGQYMLVSKAFLKPESGKKSITFLQKLPDKKVQFPQDKQQIPDLILYFARGERQKDRISFIRIPAKNLVSSTISNPMSIYSLKGDLSLDNFQNDQPGGFITARAHLFSSQPPETRYSLIHEFGSKMQFCAKIFLYRAKNLPPMNQTGDCDPKLVFHFSNQKQQICPNESNRTYNPIWNQVVSLNFQTEDFMNVNIQKALICNVFDQQKGKKDNFIGNFMVKISKKDQRKYQGKNKQVEFLYIKPKWYPIINQKVDIGDPCFGYLLIGCAVFKKQDIQQFNKPITIQQPSELKTFQLFLLGVRGLKQYKDHINNTKVYFQIKVGQNQTQTTNQFQMKLNSVCVNQMVTVKAQIPKNRNITPYVDIKIFEKTGQKTTFVGFSSSKLSDVVQKITGKAETNNQRQQNKINTQYNQQNQQQETLFDLDQLDQQLNIVRARKKQREQLAKAKFLKLKKIDVENMPVPKQLLSTTNQTDKNSKLQQLLKLDRDQFQNIDDEEQDYKKKLQKQNDKKTFQLLEKRSQYSEKLSKRSEIHEQNFQDQQKKSLKHNVENMLNKKKQKQEDLQKYSSTFGLYSNTQKRFIKPQFQQQQNMRKPKKKQLQQQLQSQKSKSKQKKSNLQQQNLKNIYNEAKYRYSANSEQMIKNQKKDNSKDSDVISNFNLKSNTDIDQVSHDERAITYNQMQRIIKQQQKFTKQAMQRQQNYKYAAAVKLSLFRWKQDKKNTQKETYQDYDTDPQEPLDIIPEWYKNRKILAADFEQLVPNKKIKSLPIFQGGNRIRNLDVRQKKIVGHIKLIGLAVKQQHKQQKEKRYIRLLKPRSYVCRIYILKGKSLISNFNKKPSTYLRISCKNIVYDLQKTTLCKDQYNPEYYVCQQVPMDLPGPSTVKIQVLEEMGILNSIGISRSRILGYTQIDIEQRHFTKKWHFFTEKKPIQLRNLYSEFGNGTKGRLQVWVDIIDKKDWLNNPPFKIHPPPFDKYQLRVIVWSTKQCVYKNQAFKSNDVFVRGFLGTSQAQETDTHWACRGTGNFNYRFKFQANYPPKPQDMYSDQFVIQIWDRDVIGYNNLIGQKRINLNKIHRIIEKAVKRNKPVKAKMKIKQKGLALTQKFWFDVYNHKVKDQFGQLQSQGKVQLSFQLIPKQAADKSFNNGFGRQQPNVFPTLAQPAGRLNFNILHPLDFFKQLCGPELYDKICSKLLCCFVIAIILLFGYLMIGNIAAVAIVNSGTGSTTTTTTTTATKASSSTTMANSNHN